MKAKLIKPIAVILVISVLIAIFSGDDDLIAPDKTGLVSSVSPPSVSLKLESTLVNDYASVSGYLETQTEVHLTPRVSATIVDIAVRVGDVISKGDVLVTIDPRDAQSTLRQAESGLTAAKTAAALSALDYDRAKLLLDQQAATQQQLDQVTALHKANIAAADIAARQLEQAKTNLGYYQVKSTLQGVVKQRFADAGDLAQPGKAILILGSTDSLEFKGALRESLRPYLNVDDSIVINTAGGLQRARVTAISPSANVQAHSFEVTALVEDSKQIAAGMHGSFEVVSSQRQAVIVPKSSLRIIGQLQAVKVKVGDRWLWRNVRTRLHSTDEVEVVAGLQSGDVIGLSYE
ncbi:MAG: efflux RND transporter periplasmic adaptor subunit [Planctomycetes bacterium]|nr:efflux RND transporter periplasmic adaptor subunit [Planctomycetota bacterium]